jgi:hypothetical protein
LDLAERKKEDEVNSSSGQADLTSLDPVRRGRRGGPYEGQPRDRDDPDPYRALYADPTIPIGREPLALELRDLKRWSRRYLLPATRLMSLTTVFFIALFKRVVGVVGIQFRAHTLIDVLCLWFVRRFVSQEAAAQLIRHFIVETKLINFVIKNSGDPDLALYELEPKSLQDLGSDNCVVVHDTNIYNFVIDVGESERASLHRPAAELDFSGLELPDIDTEPSRRRWINLDIETALYLMNIPFCLFTTEDEYERAVNSFQCDETLLALIANLTGDPVFRTWTPIKFPVWRSIRRDVPRDLFWHAVVNEYAYTRLIQTRDGVL